jgi:protein-S-isoprenylcysteine O-methyltransferase Ste14
MSTREPDRAGSPAAYASNWWRVLLVDALVGLAVAAAGVLLLVAGHSGPGWLLAALGVVYVLAIVGRYRVWRQRRARAGLDD